MPNSLNQYLVSNPQNLICSEVPLEDIWGVTEEQGKNKLPSEINGGERRVRKGYKNGEAMPTVQYVYESTGAAWTLTRASRLHAWDYAAYGDMNKQDDQNHWDGQLHWDESAAPDGYKGYSSRYMPGIARLDKAGDKPIKGYRADDYAHDYLMPPVLARWGMTALTYGDQKWGDQKSGIDIKDRGENKGPTAYLKYPMVPTTTRQDDD